MTTLRDIWQRALDILGKTKRQTLIIGVVGLFLPQVAIGLYLDARSGGVAAGLRQVYEATAATPTFYSTLAEPGMGFFAELMGLSMAGVVMLMAAYFALLHVVVAAFRGEPPPAAGKALALGLRTALPKGLILILAFVLLSFIGQIFVAPAILIAILSLNVPVLLVAEKQGAWRSMVNAVTLRYARPYGWVAMFMLMSVAALLYIVIAVAALGSDALMDLDQHLGVARGPWLFLLPGMPFGPFYLATEILETALVVAALSIMPALTASLYFAVLQPRAPAVPVTASAG